MPPLIGSIGGISEYAYRGTLDDYPDEFLFNNITNAEPGVNYTSGITTIAGINYKTKVSVGAGGSFSVNGDAFSTAPRFLRSGDELELSLTTVKDNLTTDFSRENNLVVFVGKRETIWSVTTRDINNNLVPVGFTSVTNHPVESSINSNTVNISGLETGYSTPVSVIGFNASISINGGSLVTSGTVSNGDNFYVNLPALSTTEQESYGRTRTTSITVGTYTTTWTVITESPDLTPDAFSFTNVTDAQINTTYTSNSITVSGINDVTIPKFSIPISISGSGFEYNINGGAFTSQPGLVVSGDVIALRTTPISYETTSTGTLTINGVSSSWSVTTGSQPFDTVPNPFSFSSLVDTPQNTTFTSNEITLSGMTAEFPATATISGTGEFRVVRNGIVIRDYSSSSTNVQLGDKITLRNTSSSSYSTTKTTTFIVSGTNLIGEPGTTSASWNITTEAPPPPPTLPTITLNASSTTITQGESATLTWSSTDATSVSSSNFGATTVSGSTTVSPSTNTTYNITVSGPGGSVSATVTVTVLLPPTPPAPPTITLNASSTSVIQGNSVTLTWSSTDATSVTSSNFGATTVNGSLVVTPSVTTTYNITVSGPGGSVSASITVNVSASPPPSPLPTITLNASSTSVIQGNSVTLTWSSTDATSVTSSNFGAATVSGSTTVSPLVTTTYNITVSGPGGSVSASVTVNVSSSAPLITLNASSTTIDQGESTTLTWSSTDATSVSSSNFGATTVSGSTTVTPSSTTTYTITVSGPGGSTTATVTVTVLPPPTAPTLILVPSQSIAQGESATFYWSSTDATSVSSSNFGATTVNGSTTVTPSVSTTYNITVSGPGGSASASVTIIVLPPPTITLRALPSTTITQGSSVTLSWNSTNATSITSSNFDTTSSIPTTPEIFGSTTVTPSSTTTYFITVSGPGGSTTATVTVTVLLRPTITLTAVPSSITQGESTILTWSSTDATSVSFSNFGATTVNGSTTVTPSITTIYAITVSGPGGSTTATVNISVSPPPTPPPTVSLSASPLSISKGSSSTLTWSSTNATSVTSSNFGAATVNGSTTVSPSSIGTTPYNITVSGPGGSADASVNISVYCIPIEGQYGSLGATGFTGYLLYGNGFKDSNLQFITNPGNSALSNTTVTTAGGITTTYRVIGEVVINHYVNNFARYPEQSGGYDYWVLDFINNPSYTNFTIFTNAITTAYYKPGGESEIRASRGGLVGNYDSCDVKRL